jgi:hypothetical protein
MHLSWPVRDVGCSERHSMHEPALAHGCESALALCAPVSSRAGASTCCLEAKGVNHGHADVSRLCYIAAACCLTADAGPRSHGVKLTRYAFHASAEDGAPLRLAMHGQDLFRRACALCPIPI